MAEPQRRYEEEEGHNNDHLRGIQNAKRIHREKNSSHAANDNREGGVFGERRVTERAAPETRSTAHDNSDLERFRRLSDVEERFGREQSIEARTYNAKEEKRKQGKRLSDEKALGQALHAEEQRTPTEVQKQVLTQAKKKLRRGVKPAAVARKGMSVFARTMGLGVLCFIYLLQLGFGFVSAAAFSMHAAYEATVGGSLVDSLLTWAKDAVNYLSDTLLGFNILFSAQEVGFAFWIIATVLAVVTFAVYCVWYYVLGIRPFGTILAFLVSVTCLIFSILPFLNLFPWIILWALYINASSVFLRQH